MRVSEMRWRYKIAVSVLLERYLCFRGRQRVRMWETEGDVRRSQEGGDALQDLGVAQEGIIKAWGVKEDDAPPIKSETTRNLNLGCARAKAFAHGEF